ncbi:MAG: hypothetical protein ACP6IQ_02625 [Candidatus Njordarchaeia archaeon]
MNYYVKTLTGHYYFGDFNQIEIIDIAHALSMQCRFNGHISKFYSVAEHCVKATELLEKIGYNNQTKLHMLLHDAAEAYIGDIPKPYKDMLDKLSNNLLTNTEEAILGDIYQSLDLKFPNQKTLSIIKTVDKLITVIEGVYFFGADEVKQWNLIEPIDACAYNVLIECWDSQKAKEKFMEKFEVLYGKEK